MLALLLYPVRRVGEALVSAVLAWIQPTRRLCRAFLPLPNPSPYALSSAPPDNGSTALVVVDVQTCWYSQSPTVRAAFPELPERMAALLKFARDKGVPVIHVRANYDASPHAASMRQLNPSLNRVPITNEAEAWAAELPGEAVVVKSVFDAFYRTDLEAQLRQSGATRLLVCGLVTSACVLNTSFGAFFRNFDVVLVEDCCADRSRMRHEATLALYVDYCFRTIRCRDLHRLVCGTPSKPAAAVASPESSPESSPELSSSPNPHRLEGALRLDFPGKSVSPTTTIADLAAYAEAAAKGESEPLLVGMTGAARF